MDLDALLTGINWEFETFGEYMAALRRRSPYLNVAVLTGHSVIPAPRPGRRSVRAQAGDARGDGEDEGHGRRCHGRGRSGPRVVLLAEPLGLRRRAHAIRMITDLSELDELVGAMGPRGRGVVQLASGTGELFISSNPSPRSTAFHVQDHGRRHVQRAGTDPGHERVRGLPGSPVPRQPGADQVPCQPLSFDFSMENAYPFFSHDAFGEIEGIHTGTAEGGFKYMKVPRLLLHQSCQPPPGVLFFQGNGNAFRWRYL